MEIKEKGQCGDKVFYELTDDGVLTIWGEGDMYDYDTLNRSPFDCCYNKYLKSVIIKDGVTSIGRRAFHGSTLVHVEIPSSIMRIAHAAFYFSQNLVSVEMPDSITEIEDFAFSSCTSLVSIILPKSVEFIGTGVFQWTPELTSITILNLTPPVTGNLRAIYNSCMLRVPKGSKLAYANHEEWGRFKSIEEIVK